MEDKKVESTYSIYKTEYLFPEDGDLIYVCVKFIQIQKNRRINYATT